MKKKNSLVKTSLACALIFGGVGLLAGCGGGDDPKVTISDIYVTGDYADNVKEFTLGSDISLAGATVEVSFSDGTKQTVTITDEMWKKEDYNFTTIGEKEITVKFKVNDEEKSETIKIKIVNPLSVQEVITAINDLNNSSHDRFMESTADSIKTSYNALNDTNKALVTNYNDFFAIYKAIKKDVISNYVTVEDYEESDRATITGYVETATAAIESAGTLADVDSAISSGKTSINAIETTLEIRKGVVLDAFDTYVIENFDSEDYTIAKWTLLQTLIQEAREEIETATDIHSLPNIEYGYYNASFMEIDNIVTENLKADIAELPDSSTITTYDAALMSKVKAILNTYENVLTYQEKTRISNELIEQVEDVEFELGTLDLNAYKANKIDVIQEFMDKENEYDTEEWQTIVSLINNAISEINNLTYSEDAKEYVDDTYADLMDSIYDEATIKVKELHALINVSLPENYHYVNSDKIIFNQYGEVYNIYDNEFKIDDTLYTISGNSVSDGETTYEIENGKFTVNDTTFTIVDVQTSVSNIKTLFNELSTEEKGHYKAIEVRILIEKYEGIVTAKTTYLKEKIEMLNGYLDEDIYNTNRIEEIQSLIEQFKYLSVSGYTIDDYKNTLDYYYEDTIEDILAVKNKLDDIKDSIRNELAYNSDDYYQNEIEEIEDIIENAVEEGNAIVKEGNETIADAVGRVQAIIDTAKEEIAEVKTLLEIHSEEVDKLIGDLKEYINVNDYVDLGQIEDLDDELTNESPDIVKAYKEAVAELENTINENNSLEYLQETFEGVKANIIDYVNRTYSIVFDASDLNDRINNVIYNSSEQLSDKYYVEIGGIRNSVGNSYYYLTNNGLGAGNVSIDANVYKYTSDYKVENGKLYLALPYLMFNGPSIEFNVSFSDLTTKDIYTITINGAASADEAVKNTNIYVYDYGAEADTQGDVGYFTSDNSFRSYKKDSQLSFNYKNGDNYVNGLTILKWNSQNGTNYSFVDLEEGQQLIVYPNGVGARGWATEDTQFINYNVSIYNAITGIDNNDLTFKYIEYVNLDGAKETYGNLMDEEINGNAYLPSDLTAAQAIVDEFKEKLSQITDKGQFDTLWESDGSVGEVDTTNNTITIEGNAYTINGGKLMWYGVDVGTYVSTFARSASSSVSLNNIILKISDGFVYLVDESDEIKIGVYDSNEFTITLYSNLGDSEPNPSLRYVISGGDVIRTYGNYIPSVVGSAVIDGENINITLGEKLYIVSENIVIDEDKIGFINRLNDIEVLGDPIVTIGGDTLTLKQKDNYDNENCGGYYEYEIKLGTEELYLDVSGFDSSGVIVELNGWREATLPYDVTGLNDGTNTIDIYLADGETFLKRYELYITRESAINTIKVNDTIVENCDIAINRMNATNSISVDIKEGYTYKVIDNYAYREITDLNNVIFRIGRNEYSIIVCDSNGDEVDYSSLYVYVGGDILSQIKFNDSYISDESYVDVYNDGSVTSVTIDYSDVNDIASIDILDIEGNSLLDSQGKLNVEGLPFIRFKIKVVIGDVTYNSNELILVNTNEYGIGEIWRDSWNEVTHENIFGLNYYIDFKYDSKVRIIGDMGYSIYMENGQFIFETLIAPKGYDASKISAIVSNEYIGEGKITLTQVGATNIFKLVVTDANDAVDSIIYYIIEESEDAIDDDASMVSGIITLEEYMDDYFEDDFDEIKPILEEKKTELTQVTYSAGDEYYLEGIDEYYTGSIKADAGDIFYAYGNNLYQTIAVSADFLLNMDYDSPIWIFMNNFSTDSVIIVDVTSSDGTKQVRYIYNIEKKAPDLSAQIIVGEGNDAVSSDAVEFRINMGMVTEGTMYGDFFAMDEYATEFVAFVGEQQVENGDTVTLKLSVSDLLKSSGVITLDGNYDKDDPTSYLSETDLDGVQVVVNSMEVEQGTIIPAVTFFAHQIDGEGNEDAVIIYTLLFMENLMNM